MFCAQIPSDACFIEGECGHKLYWRSCVTVH